MNTQVRLIPGVAYNSISLPVISPAEAVQDKILSIDPATVPVKSTERLYRKQLAPLVRALLKELGIKGASVTTPNYSMAQSVKIRIPEPTGPGDYIGPDGKDYQNCSFSEMPDDAPIKIRNRKNRAAQDRLEAILLAAFPGCNDRSDYQTDCFDYLFSFC